MIEKVVSRKNMRRAYQQVLRNEGSAGEDGMSVQELSKHLKVNRDKSPILVTTITLSRLVQRGYESMLSYYEKVSPQLNEPLYTRPVQPVPIFYRDTVV